MGFTAGVLPEAITPVVISKIIAGVLAIALALAMSKNTDNEDRQSAEIEKAELKKAAAA